MNKLSLHICIVVLCSISFAAKAQYTGGSGVGFKSQSIIASLCPAPLNANIYFGGSADGFAYRPLITSICPPKINANIYFGGNADGFAYRPLINSICPPKINANIYFGGNADGFAYRPLITSICPPKLNATIYFGGRADAFSYKVLNQSPCMNITPLPIELLNFEAAYMEESGFVELKWSTATEIDNDFFTVESSQDGSNWTEILRKEGAGTTNQLMNYKDFDKHPYNGINYYRLKQTDYDGDYSYSKILAVNILNSIDYKIITFPNPVNTRLNISSPGISFEEIFIIDNKGAIVAQQLNPSFSENIQIDFGRFKNGNYLIKLKTKNTIATKKITVVHR